MTPIASDIIALYRGRAGLPGATFAEFQAAAFTTITNLDAVVTPAPTDEFAVVQADGVARRETRAQIHTLENGERLLVQGGDAAAPTIGFGDGDSGFFEVTDDNLNLTLGSFSRWRWAGGDFFAFTVDGPLIKNEASTATNPTLSPNKSDRDTGIGHRTDDVGVLIAGAVNVMEFGEAGGAPLWAVYGTAAIAQQTGVAVTAAGIHAACVALGIFTA